jgi:RNA polymerase sigma factor (sigma-70 family)
MTDTASDSGTRAVEARPPGARSLEARPPEARAWEAWLVASARLGDGDALAGLVHLRGPRLYAHARRLTDDADTARDIVQEAWIAVMRGLGRLQDDCAFLPWALRIVTRLAARDVRGRIARRRLAAGIAAEPVMLPDTPATDDGAALHRALAALPREQASVLALFYLEDMRVAEVAIALDIPPGTVKTRLMHGRARLRAILEGQDNGQI